MDGLQIRQLKSAFDKDAAGLDLNAMQDVHVNDVASLMKLYFRELPEPLTTFGLYESWIACTRESGQVRAHAIFTEIATETLTNCMSLLGESGWQTRVNSMRKCIDTLPQGNRSTLGFLVAHLCRVAKQSPVNKMTPSNLAIVFAPGLVRSQDEVAALRDFRLQCEIVEDLINNFGALFV